METLGWYSGVGAYLLSAVGTGFAWRMIEIGENRGCCMQSIVCAVVCLSTAGQLKLGGNQVCLY